MPNQTLTLINPLGLHARAAAKLVDVAKQYGAQIQISVSDGQPVDAKSIMALLMLGAPVDSEVSVHTEGADADDAMQAIAELINAGFYELDE
ncbi:MAG: HPr family phosphocarrier protein [Pseudomonadota bacterium]